MRKTRSLTAVRQITKAKFAFELRTRRRDYMKVMVGIDLSKSTETTVRKTEELATECSAKVWILHVAKPEPEFVEYKDNPK